MKIANNSTYINPSGLQKRTQSFYTSNDAELKRLLEDEWYMRIYWQGVDTFNRGGYIVFDTFTYDDAHLPRLRDFFPPSALVAADGKDFGSYGCFNRSHFPDFIKKLRLKLEYDGYDVKDNIKYLYVTEYGHDALYTDDRGRQRCGTMRPHYHLLLFVTDPNLSPKLLNYYIGKLWTFGFHDNGKSVVKFRKNLFNCTLNDIDKKVRLRGLANYVGKYMHKDSDYEDKIGKRIDAVAFSLCPKPCFDTDESKMVNGMRDDYRKSEATDSIEYVDIDLFDKVERTAISYTSLANDFKPSFKNESEWRKEWNICRNYAYSKIATFHGQSKHFGEYALNDPTFDIQHVVKEGTMKMPDKDNVWKYLPIPLYYRRKLFYEQVKKDDGKLMWKLKDDENSIEFYKNKTYRQAARLADVYLNIHNTMLTLPDRLQVDLFMNGRSYNDLAVYDVFFHDSMFDCDLADITPQEIIDIRLIQDFSCSGVNGNEKNIGQHYKCIDENSSLAFKDFDKVLHIFEPYMTMRHEAKQKAFDRKTSERKSLKQLGFKPTK